MLKIGIVSTANIGVAHVIPAIQNASNCTVAAVASRDRKRARKLACRFDVPLTFGTYEELLASDEIDAVYIPLPTSQHVEWTLKAAAAGKHVLCEKPIALNAADIKSLIKARDKHGVVVSEAFMVTYHPQWLKVREIISKGSICKLRHVQASFAYHNLDADNMRNRVELGGGVIPDIAVYPVVATRFATGAEPHSLRATVEFDPEFKTDRYATVHAQFEGFDLSFYVSTQMALRQSIAFHGDKGFIELTAPFNSNLYAGDELRLHNQTHSEVRSFSYTGVDQYQCQVEAFARACSGKSAGKKQSLFSLEDSYANQRVIDAIYKSAKKSAVVKV